jgi:hypothetical protein
MQTNTAKFTGKPVEVVPAGTVSTMKTPQKSMLRSIMPAFVALGFGGLVCMFMPAASAELNLTFVGTLFSTLFAALTSIMPSFETFIDAGFPLLIKIIIYVAIIGVIGLGLYFFREVIQKIIHMIGF